MDSSDAKKIKIKVVDIIKKPDKKAEVIQPAGSDTVKKQEGKSENSADLVSALKQNIKATEEKNDQPKKKNDELEKLFEKIDRKEKEVLGRHASPQTIKREIPHLREDSINIPLPPKTPALELKKGEKWKKFVWTAIIILIAGAAYGAYAYLPKSDIKISVKKFKWPPDNYDNPVILSSKITAVDVNQRQIPVAIFSQKNNASFSYPASGKKYIERKASGMILVHNAFSTSPQVLVSGTRVQSPDGKIFKFTDRIAVPGATVKEGTIVPSSIEARVVAEKAGEPYNIGMVSRFSIPGFQGTSKYDKFYGETKTAIGGGFIGEAAFPTDADIKNAKDAAEKSLQSLIEAFIISQISSDEFKIINSSKQFSIIKENVNTTTDDSGNFSVFVEAQLSMTAFKKADMLNLLTQMAKQVIITPLSLILKQDEYSINYGDISVDPKTKTISLPVKFSGVFWQPLDANEFRQKIAGKSETDLKTIIYSYPNIEKADFSFWPFWASKVPSNQNRVNITVN